MNAISETQVVVGVVIPECLIHAFELLGDAASLANRLGGRVAACTTQDDSAHLQQLNEHGADEVTVLEGGERGPNNRLAGVESWWQSARPRLVFAAASGDDRTLAARLAVRSGVKLVSPALSVTARGQALEILASNADGRCGRMIRLTATEMAIVTLRLGVGQPRLPRSDRAVETRRLSIHPQHESTTVAARLPADPATTDIIHLPRLVAGGRGLGNREGFELLREVAARLNAGIAASRMAVDLGWIERDRQVGQTGKTVQPELYLACGISGASHHREGMAESRHIIALNVDPKAPIFQIADLGLVADWREVLQHFLESSEPLEHEER